jgi:hypothetical protein
MILRCLAVTIRKGDGDDVNRSQGVLVPPIPSMPCTLLLGGRTTFLGAVFSAAIGGLRRSTLLAYGLWSYDGPTAQKRNSWNKL